MYNMLRAPITYVGISQVKSAYAFVKTHLLHTIDRPKFDT